VLAPIAWGTTYVTVTELLPPGRPLLVAAARVLPAGLTLVAAGLWSSRWRPRGAEWGRTALLALCNFGLFLPLLVVAVYRLPGGVAAAAGGLQPLFVAGLSWLLVGRRPPRRELVVGVVAMLGVGLIVVRPGADIDAVGVLAAVAANLSFAVGVVLTKRFPAPANRIAATGWQLLLSAVLLVPVLGRGRGPTTAADDPEPRWLRVPRADRDRRRLRRMVRRDPTLTDGGATIARSRRAGHRCAARVGRARSVPVDDPTRGLRHHARGHRLRRGARKPGDVNASPVTSATP